MSSLYKENLTTRIENLFGNLQNDVLGEFNKGTISSKEMKNILIWCEKMKDNIMKESEKED